MAHTHDGGVAGVTTGHTRCTLAGENGCCSCGGTSLRWEGALTSFRAEVFAADATCGAARGAWETLMPRTREGVKARVRATEERDVRVGTTRWSLSPGYFRGERLTLFSVSGGTAQEAAGVVGDGATSIWRH